MPTMTDEKRYALEWIDEHARSFSDFHSRIWNYAEPAWREYKSAKAYCDLLRAEGFAVEEGSGEMPTAFCARWGKSGPVLGTYAEYDAVPGNSQQVVPHQAPRAGLHPWAAGHTDPHSALGTTALAGALAAKAAMERFRLDGTLFLFGEPAERSAARSRCTPRRGTTTAPTPSSPTTRISPTQRSATRSAAPIGVWSLPLKPRHRRSGSTRA